MSSHGSLNLEEELRVVIAVSLKMSLHSHRYLKKGGAGKGSVVISIDSLAGGLARK